MNKVLLLGVIDYAIVPLSTFQDSLNSLSLCLVLFTNFTILILTIDGSHSECESADTRFGHMYSVRRTYMPDDSKLDLNPQAHFLGLLVGLLESLEIRLVVFFCG